MSGADDGQPKLARKRKPRRWPYVLVTLVALIAAGALAFPPLLRDQLVKEAARNGVVLSLGEVEVGWTEVVVRNCRFRLAGVPQLRGEVTLLTIGHERGELRTLKADGVALEITGSASIVAVEFSQWAARQPQLLGLASEATHVDVSWRGQPDASPWLIVHEATVTPSDAGATLMAEQVEVLGLDVGSVGARWSREEDRILLGVGDADPELAPVVLSVVRGSPPASSHSAEVTLRPTALEKLAQPLDVPLPIEGVTASGTAAMAFDDVEQGAVAGTLSAKFKGYTPPVPADLKSFVFGDTSLLNTDIALDAQRTKVDLTNMRVTHGRLKLTGGGTILRHEKHATIAIELRANLSCAALADAAARTRLGPELGELLGGVARSAVEGSVGIRLKIDADSRALDKAKLEQHIGVGCGLAAMRALPGWPDLTKVPALGDLGAGLGAELGR